MGYDSSCCKRKSLRLANYDYASPGSFFVTICCQNRCCYFGIINEAKVILNDSGKMVERWIFAIKKRFHSFSISEHVVMPNHVHLLIDHIGSDDVDDQITLMKVIQWFKTMTTNEYLRCVHKHGWPSFDKRLWQRNYYDHIVRNEQEWFLHRQYILNNPFKWNVDDYYHTP